MAKAKAKAKVEKSGTATRKRRGVKIQPTQLAANQLGPVPLEGPLAELAEAVAGDGGAVLAAYREPLGGHALLLVSLPVAAVVPTPFQRDVSDAHVRKLTRAMDKTRRFLDPIIVVRDAEGYMTPNGNHRLTVLKELGSKAVVGLLVPERDVAYQILALNIEKAHNLREKAIEVMRMCRDLAGWTDRQEKDFELEFEEPALVTLGFAYGERGRLSGGAYHPVLRKVDSWIDGPLASAAGERERRAQKLLALDDAVSAAVAKLKAKGFQSPYLKNFVIARVNPLRFAKGEPPTFDALLDDMTQRASRLDADKIRPEDVARSGGGAPEES
jgi:ParB family chromosome partitioning protein